MQEYRIGQKGVGSPTKNHLTMPVELIAQFRSALDQVEVLIQERRPEESGADGPDHKEEEPVAEDDAGDGHEHEQEDDGEDVGLETAPSSAHDDGTSSPTRAPGMASILSIGRMRYDDQL